MDGMSKKERMQALKQGKNMDRIPIMAMGRAYCASLGNISLKEFYDNPELAYEVQKWTIDMHDHDGSPSYGIPSWAALDFGGELCFPNNKYGEPFSKYNLISCEEDIDKLIVPDPATAKSIDMNCKFADICCKNGGGVSIKVGTPLEIVSILLGVDNMLRWMVRNPVAVHRLLRMSTEYFKNIVKYYINRYGVEKCSAFIPLPLESNTLISKRMFEEYSMPYIKEIVDNLNSLGITKYHVHLCGNHSKNLEYWVKDINIPARAIFSIGNEMDIHEVSDILGEKYIIAGNVPSSVLCDGTPSEVYEKTKELVLGMKHRKGGYILMPECGVPSSTPPINLHAMIKAGKKFGKYI